MLQYASAVLATSLCLCVSVCMSQATKWKQLFFWHRGFPRLILRLILHCAINKFRYF